MLFGSHQKIGGYFSKGYDWIGMRKRIGEFHDFHKTPTVYFLNGFMM